MISDWIENIGILVMLKTYEQVSPLSVFIASASGIIKRIFTLASISAIFILLIIFAIKRIKQVLETTIKTQGK